MGADDLNPYCEVEDKTFCISVQALELLEEKVSAVASTLFYNELPLRLLPFAA